MPVLSGVFMPIKLLNIPLNLDLLFDSLADADVFGVIDEVFAVEGTGDVPATLARSTFVVL